LWLFWKKNVWVTLLVTVINNVATVALVFLPFLLDLSIFSHTKKNLKFLECCSTLPKTPGKFRDDIPLDLAELFLFSSLNDVVNMDFKHVKEY